MFSKELDPNDDERLGICWTDWLDQAEAIADSSWTISPSGPTLHDAAMNASTSEGTANTVYVRRVAVGQAYVLTNSVQTNSSPPRKNDRSIRITVRDR